MTEIVIPNNEEEDGEIERVNDEDDEDDIIKNNSIYEQTFDTTVIVKLLKVAGLSKQVLIYPRIGQPLKLKFIILSTSSVEILIKSRELQEEEQCDELVQAQ